MGSMTKQCLILLGIACVTNAMVTRDRVDIDFRARTYTISGTDDSNGVVEHYTSTYGFEAEDSPGGVGEIDDRLNQLLADAIRHSGQDGGLWKLLSNHHIVPWNKDVPERHVTYRHHGDQQIMP